MRLLGLDLGQWSTGPTDASLSLRSNRSVGGSNTLFTTDYPVFTAPLQLYRSPFAT